MSPKIAALLTRRSTPPQASATRSARARVESGEPTSTSTKSASPPALRISFATRSPFSLWISATTSFAPCSAKAFA
jgi:hypothetical protein